MRAPNPPPTANPSSVETLIPRFLSKVMFGDDCWEWVGSIAPGGYGRININATGGYVLAHRLSFELFVDEIPDGLTIDHPRRERPIRSSRPTGTSAPSDISLSPTPVEIQ